MAIQVVSLNWSITRIIIDTLLFIIVSSVVLINFRGTWEVMMTKELIFSLMSLASILEIVSLNFGTILKLYLLFVRPWILATNWVFVVEVVITLASADWSTSTFFSHLPLSIFFTLFLKFFLSHLFDGTQFLELKLFLTWANIIIGILLLVDMNLFWIKCFLFGILIYLFFGLELSNLFDLALKRHVCLLKILDVLMLHLIHVDYF